MLIKYNLRRHRGCSWVRDILERRHRSDNTSTYLLLSLTPSSATLNPDFSPSYITVTYGFNLALAVSYDQLLSPQPTSCNKISNNNQAVCACTKTPWGRILERGGTHDQGSWTSMLETGLYPCFCPVIMRPHKPDLTPVVPNCRFFIFWLSDSISQWPMCRYVKQSQM